MNMLAMFDSFSLGILLICAVDIIRQTNPLRHPFHALGFVAMAIGASAWILQDLSGLSPSWYSVLFHGGLAIYSALGAYALWAHKRESDNVDDCVEVIEHDLRAVIGDFPSTRSAKDIRPSVH